MPIIAITSGKGGSGKSTTALALAAMLAKAHPPIDGKPQVFLLDADAQHSASWAIGNQIEAGYEPGFDWTEVGVNDAPMIAKVDRLGYAWVVIDTAAAIADKALKAALEVADLTLMPIPPDPMDLDALFKALIGVVIPSGAPYRVLVTRVDPRRAAAGQEAVDTLGGKGVKVLPRYVREYAAHKRGHLEGRPVTSFTGRDRLAAADYGYVLEEVMEVLNAQERTRLNVQ